MDGIGRHDQTGLAQGRRSLAFAGLDWTHAEAEQWFNLLEQAVEDAPWESRAMRQFVGIDLGDEPVPD